MGLEDVGKQVQVEGYQFGDWTTLTVTVVMGIETPKGKMFLFGDGYMDEKVEAIKTFMEQHKEG